MSVQKYFVSSDIHLCRPIGLGQHSGTNNFCKFPLIILRFADKFLVTSIGSRLGPKFYRIFYSSVEEEGEQNDSVNSYFSSFSGCDEKFATFHCNFIPTYSYKKAQSEKHFLIQRMLSPRVVHDFGKLPTKNGARVSRRG